MKLICQALYLHDSLGKKYIYIYHRISISPITADIQHSCGVCGGHGQTSVTSVKQKCKLASSRTTTFVYVFSFHFLLLVNQLQ